MDTERLPLFPLNVVLFPDALLPLHIFEKRYLQLIGECLDRKAPFGVVLMRHGFEVGAPAVPYEVGTRARVRTHSLLDDGRMNIVVEGGERFRVVAITRRRPYLVAEVERFVEAPCLEPPGGLATQVRRQFDRHVQCLFELVQRPVADLPLPKDPQTLSFFVAGRSRLSLQVKQRLLEMTTTEERLQFLADHLRTSNARQEAFLRLAPLLGPVHSDVGALMDAFVPLN